MPIGTPTGYLDITNATLRGSQIVTTGYVGIANANPVNHLSVGSNLHINDTHSNVLQISGNINAAGVVLGGITIAPTFDLEIVTNTGNTTPYTVEFNNTATAFVTTANATIGDTLTASKLVGDGSAISAIQSSNVSDFASNVSRIATLETDLDSNVTRIQNLESTNMTIDGEKTFSSNLEVGTANLFVDTTTGNVGIGVTNPTYELHMDGNMRIDNGGSITLYRSDTTGGPSLVFRNPDDSTSGWFGFGSSSRNEFRMVTNNNYPLTFYTSATGTGLERMRITPDGNVGIGTNSPDEKLHVYTDSASSASQLFIRNANASNRAGLSLINSDNEYFNIQHTTGGSNAAIIENFSQTNGGVKFYTKGDGRYEFRTTDSNNTRMVIENNGNVGIGTNSANALLELSGASQSDNSNPTKLRITSTTIGTTATPIDITKPYGLVTFYTPDTSSAGSGDVAGIGGRFENDLGGDTALCFYTDSDNLNDTEMTERMCITHDGNVGIGLTNPSATLHVNGSLKHGYYYSSSNEGYTSLGNNTVLIWGRVAQSITSAGQYNWTFNFPNSLTLDSILHSAVGSISDPVRGDSYPSQNNRISALGVNGFFTNKVSGHIKTDDMTDGTITICLTIIGTKA